MGQRVRTAAPGGDWRSFHATCHNANGHSQYDIIKVQDTVCVVYFETAVALGDEFYPIYHCEKIVVDKRAGTSFAAVAGQKAYWSGIDGDPVYPFHRSGFYWIGIFTEPAAAMDTTAEIDLKGDKASLTEPL